MSPWSRPLLGNAATCSQNSRDHDPALTWTKLWSVPSPDIPHLRRIICKQMALLCLGAPRPFHLIPSASINHPFNCTRDSLSPCSKWNFLPNPPLRKAWIWGEMLFIFFFVQFNCFPWLNLPGNVSLFIPTLPFLPLLLLRNRQVKDNGLRNKKSILVLPFS